MRWIEISLTAPAEYAEPIYHVFYRYAEGRVAIEGSGNYNPDEGEQPQKTDPRIIAWLPPGSSAAMAHIDLALRLIHNLHALPPLSIKEVDEADWTLEPFTTLRVGKRIVIRPPYQSAPQTKSDIVLTIDPGMSFGTGQHPTTRMMLETMENSSMANTRVLDLGSGSGILSLIAIKLGARCCLGLDVEAQAVEAATKNARISGLQEHVSFIEGSIPCPQVPPGQFDYGLANISMRIAKDKAEELLKALTPNGTALVSGMLSDQVAETTAAINAAKGRVVDIISDGDWRLLVVTKLR